MGDVIDGTVQRQGFTLAVRKLEKVPGAALDAAATGLARGLLATVGISQRDYLQGPRPQHLGEVTQRLLQSISSEVTREPNAVIGRIGTNVSYGRYQELGFHGVEQVRGFHRVIERYTGIGTLHGGRDETGRYLKSGGKKAASKQKTGVVGFEFIKPHERHVNYAGKPFIQPALRDATPMIIAEIKSDLAKVGSSIN